jgi:hypothetical protein
MTILSHVIKTKPIPLYEKKEYGITESDVYTFYAIKIHV